MAGIDTNVETETASCSLQELYRSNQDDLILTIKKSLDLGQKDPARRLDDVLLRQRFWEVDINLGDGALSDLEAADALASSIIRDYLNEIRLLLHHMNGSITDPEYVTHGESEDLSLLLEMNSRLCDQVEIFDAIAADNAADAVGHDRKASKTGQLRRQLEEENEKLHSRSRNNPQGSLRLLYSPEESQQPALVDIVAVHGFNSEHKNAEQHALDTWRKPGGDNGRFWLRDDLYGATPQARIFLYEYDSIQAFEKKGHFVSTANDLLESVRSVRQEDRYRALLFIAHGLGGLLVLQALVSAISSVMYEVIYDSTSGIAFFNTPHSFDYDRFVASDLILPKNVVDTINDTNLFADLKEMGAYRFHVNTVFFFSMAQEHDWFNASNFLTFGGRSIIELNSAPNEVCRFDWREHDQINLDIVCLKIQTLYENALKLPGIKTALSKMTRDLNTSERKKSTGEDLGSNSSASKKPSGHNFGSSSSAKTHNLKAADFKNPSDHSHGYSSSAKTHDLKASVPESSSDEELESGYSILGDLASPEHSPIH